MQTNTQLNLFQSVLESYQEHAGRLTNDQLYRDVAARANIDLDALSERTPVGKSQQQHNLIKRQVRWYQQDMKRAGLLSRVEGERGIWELTEKAGKELHRIRTSVSVIGFSTELGLCIIGSCDEVFGKNKIDTPVTLILSSPPFPLAKPRNYGNVEQAQYVDWLCKCLEPVVSNLVEGGSLCLNISPDIFVTGTPSRSTYCERLLIALEDGFFA